MSNASVILFGISVFFLLWQIMLVVFAITWIASGRIRRVRIGLMPGVVSLASCLAAIFVR